MTAPNEGDEWEAGFPSGSMLCMPWRAKPHRGRLPTGVLDGEFEGVAN